MAINDPNKPDNVINIDPGKKSVEEKAAPDQPLQAGGETPAPEITGTETVNPAEPDKAATPPAPEEKAAEPEKQARSGRPQKAEKAPSEKAAKEIPPPADQDESGIMVMKISSNRIAEVRST